MKNILLVLTLSVSLVSMAHAESKFSFFGGSRSAAPETRHGSDEGAVESFLAPIVIPDSDYIIIPVNVPRDKQGLLSSRKGGGGSYYVPSSKYSGIYHGMRHCQFENMIFYNRVTGKSTVLFKSERMIGEFFFPQEELEKDSTEPRFLLYGIHEADTNGDGRITIHDAQVVYMGNLDGSNLIQLSPSGTRFISWTHDKSTGDIYLRIQYDSNKDGSFTDRDRMTILKVDSKKPGMGEEIFSDEVRNLLKD